MKRLFVLLLLMIFCSTMSGCGEDLKRDLTVNPEKLYYNMLETMDKYLLNQDEFMVKFSEFIVDKNREFYNVSMLKKNLARVTEDFIQFMDNAKFASHQLVYRESYDEYYRQYMLNYTDFVVRLVEYIETHEPPPQELYAYKPILLRYRISFGKSHNHLLDTALGDYDTGLLELEF